MRENSAILYREVTAKDSAIARDAFRQDETTVNIHDLFTDGQFHTGAFAVIRTGFPVKHIENILRMLGVKAMSIITYSYCIVVFSMYNRRVVDTTAFLPRTPDMNNYFPSFLGKLRGIVYQVME